MTQAQMCTKRENLCTTLRNPKILLLDHSINWPVRVNYKMADEGLLPCN